MDGIVSSFTNIFQMSYHFISGEPTKKIFTSDFNLALKKQLEEKWTKK